MDKNKMLSNPQETIKVIQENGFTFHPDISLNSKYSFSMKDCRNKSQEKKNYISLWKETK